LRDYRMVPPVIELGQRLGWNPLPLSVESAKNTWAKEPGLLSIEHSPEGPSELVPSRKPSIEAAGVSVSYGSRLALDGANLKLYPGTVHALMGPNGSGKTSLLWALQGSLKHTGLVQLSIDEAGNQATPGSISAQERISHIAMVPQTAADLLVLTSVSAELEESDRFAGAPAGSTAKSFASLAGRIDPSRHPHDLSAGQQLALVLAIQLAKGASNILLDEPTRGLDYQAKRNLAAQLQSLAAAGKAVLFASHDVEFVALVADTVTLIEDGQLTLEGPASKVLATLGEHAPQVMQVTGKAWRTEQVVKP
jgi:ABC-type multidrug transport system ATPase subunit